MYSTWRIGWLVVIAAAGLGISGRTWAPMRITTPLTTDEQAFLLAAAQANVFQIEAASLAGRKATSPQVKAFAQSVLQSHARVRMGLERIARAAVEAHRG